MRYTRLTGPHVDLCGLLELANVGAECLPKLTEEQARGLKRLECAIEGRPMPGHAPGEAHHGPGLDLRKKKEPVFGHR